MERGVDMSKEDELSKGLSVRGFSSEPLEGVKDEVLPYSLYLLQHADGRFFHTTGLKDKYGRYIIGRKGDEYVLGVDVEIKDLFVIQNYG